MNDLHLHGPHGAAGLLMVVGDRIPRALLALRSGAVTHPHTWSVPAGALEAGEDPVHGALREVAEELGDVPPLEVLGTVTDIVTPRWAFHTVIARTPACVPIRADGPDGWEIAGTRWVTRESAERLPLHPRLRRTWSRLMDVATRRLHHAELQDLVDPQGLAGILTG